MSNCVFCEILYGDEPATVVYGDLDVIGIVPLNPVTEGHVIFIPRQHVRDATMDPEVTARTMRAAAEFARQERSGESMNFITSVGRPATQSVFHLHIHVVPRRENDGLALPWYSGKSTKAH